MAESSHRCPYPRCPVFVESLTADGFRVRDGSAYFYGRPAVLGAEAFAWR
jgi:hypothetical protein